MAKSVEILRDNLREHPAALAWSQFNRTQVEPAMIVVLKKWKGHFKSAVYRLAGAGPGGATIIAKRAPLRTVAVERFIYEEFLPDLPLPSLGYYGSVEDPDGQSGWMFLEDAGPHTYSLDIPEHRALAARWAATIHCARNSPNLKSLLPDHGPGYYLQLLRSNRAALVELVANPLLTNQDMAVLRALRAHFDLVESHWEKLEQDVQGWPHGVVHGDFVVKNLRVKECSEDPALLVFDWEMAGWGVQGSDLAQFIGRCASPDLEVYGSALAQNSVQMSVADIRRLAEYGSLLRLLDKISWLFYGLVTDSYSCLVAPLSTFAKYETQLAVALRALDWRQHG